MVSSKTETACDRRTDPLHRPGPFERGRRAEFKEQTQAVPVLQDPTDGAPPERHHLVNQAEHRRHLIGPEPVLISDERSCPHHFSVLRSVSSHLPSLSLSLSRPSLPLLPSSSPLSQRSFGLRSVMLRHLNARQQRPELAKGVALGYGVATATDP